MIRRAREWNQWGTEKTKSFSNSCLMAYFQDPGNCFSTGMPPASPRLWHQIQTDVHKTLFFFFFFATCHVTEGWAECILWSSADRARVAVNKRRGKVSGRRRRKTVFITLGMNVVSWDYERGWSRQWTSTLKQWQHGKGDQGMQTGTFRVLSPKSTFKLRHR